MGVTRKRFLRLLRFYPARSAAGNWKVIGTVLGLKKTANTVETATAGLAVSSQRTN
jgi:hypothetical protein